MLLHADKVVAVTNSVQEAELLIKEMEKLALIGLNFDSKKCKIVANRVMQKVTKKICGIKVQKNYKYLGLKLGSRAYTVRNI